MIVMDGWPELTFEESENLLSEDAEYKASYEQSYRIRVQGEEMTFRPLNDVFKEQVEGMLTYYKLGFMSESDLAKATGMSGKQLKVEPVQLNLEQHGNTARGYLVSLDGIPDSMYRSMRKVKIFSKCTLRLQETHLHQDKMLRQGHGEAYFSFLSKQSVDAYPAALKASQRHHVLTWAAVQKKVSDVQQAIRQGWCCCKTGLGGSKVPLMLTLLQTFKAS